MKIEFQDKIDDYLLKRMSDEECLAFEKETDSNEELQEQLSFTENVRQVLKARNEKLVKMEEWQDDYKWTDSSPINSSKRRLLYWASGIAAVFVVGFFLIRNHNVSKSPESYYTSPEMSDDVFRAGSDNTDIKLLINQKKYEQALSLIEEKSQKLMVDSIRLTQHATIDESRKEYGLQIAKNKHDALKWLKVQVLLGLGQLKAAQQLLDEMGSTDGHYQVLADSLNKQLNR